MNYKLYKEPIDFLAARQQILYNRGIPVDQQETWLNAGWESISNWRAFGEKQMIEAARELDIAIEDEQTMCVIVDCDCDGSTSAAVFINYMYHYYPNVKIDYILHTGKQHGLADLDLDYLSTYDVVICPDSASNDYKQHKYLQDRHTWVLILDHHICDEYSLYATTINNQMCEYPDKNLSGVGVTWQFLRAHEELYNKKNDGYTNQLLDLVALGNCGDMEPLTELEIRAVTNLGFSQIKNPFFYEMVKTNDYSIQKMNGINYLSIAFYVVPYINAIWRSGTQKEKDIVFRAMCTKYAFDEVDCSKRGHKGEKVKLYQEAVTIAQRVKRVQTKLQDDAMVAIEKHIKNENLLDNAVLAVVCEPGEVEKGIAGLVANKLQAKYQHPSMVLIKTKEKNDYGIVYRGSARNYSLCENQDFKAECDKTGDMELAQGHSNAFGAAIKEEKFQDYINKTNEQYKDIDLTPTYWVDYIWNQNTIDSQKILDIADLNIYGQEIPESLVVIENIPLSENNVILMSPDKNPTLKIQCGPVSIIKFKSSQEEWEKFIQPNTLVTIIGKCNKNEWMGKTSSQILVEYFELQQKWVF